MRAGGSLLSDTEALSSVCVAMAGCTGVNTCVRYVCLISLFPPFSLYTLYIFYTVSWLNIVKKGLT